MVMIKSKISRITQPKKKKKHHQSEEPGHRWQWPLWHHQPGKRHVAGFFWAGTGRGFRRSSRHSHVTCPKRCCEKFRFFLRNIFCPGGGGGGYKKKEGGNAKLTRIFSWSATKWYRKFQSWKERAQLVKNFVCVCFKKKRGVPIFSNIFCLVKHWRFPFCYWFGGRQEVGSWGFGKCHWHCHTSAFASQGKS